jgi:c-di-GMP-binding flagellar brake protein YcgR
MIEEIKAENIESKVPPKNAPAVEVNELLQAKIGGDTAVYFSRINDIQASQFVIAWPTSRGIRMALRPGQVLELAFVREGSAYGFTGLIQEANPDPLPQIIIKPNSPISPIQRRQNFRVKCMMPVHITGSIPDKSTEAGDNQSQPLSIQTVTYDLSAGGISIRHAIRIPEESVVEVRIKLPDGGSEIKVPGRIAYSGSIPGNQSLYHMGIDYLAINDWEQARIIRCLYRIQLKSVRM